MHTKSVSQNSSSKNVNQNEANENIFCNINYHIVTHEIKISSVNGATAQQKNPQPEISHIYLSSLHRQQYKKKLEIK